MSPISTILFISFFINFIDAAKILAVFPMPAISHQSAFRPITQELARRGHEVTVITPIPAFPKNQAPKNLREIDVHSTTHAAWKELMRKIQTKNIDDVYSQVKLTMKFIITYVERQFQDPEVQELINDKNEKFDLMLMEHCTKIALVYSHLYQLPVIEISSFGSSYTGIFGVQGAPSHPIIYPTWHQQKLSNFTIQEKIKILRNYYYDFNLLLHQQDIKENAMMKRVVGEYVASFSEIRKNVEMVFLNVHPVWEDNRPVPPNIIYLGGIHQKPEKELPEDIKAYLSSSRYGVIYFSLGTCMQSSLMPPDKVQMMLHVFSNLAYDILWIYDKALLPGKPSNVRIESWVPQADLLRHPKVKLFIMQGGIQSTDEAITAGVPVVTIPKLADQKHNAERHVLHKIGVKLNLETLTEEIFKNAIETVISDESYRWNIVKLRDKMNSKPQSSLERAVWWIEHALRHGGAVHLRSPGAHMPWTEYYEMQLVSEVIVSLSAAAFLIVYIVYSSWRYIRILKK